MLMFMEIELSQLLNIDDQYSGAGVGLLYTPISHTQH